MEADAERDAGKRRPHPSGEGALVRQNGPVLRQVQSRTFRLVRKVCHDPVTPFSSILCLPAATEGPSPNCNKPVMYPS
jgi:hypothetical protein